MAAVRALLSGYAALMSAGRDPKAQLDAKLIKRKAERTTGLSNWGEPDSVAALDDALQAALSSLRASHTLNALGCLALARSYQHHMQNRLRVIAQLNSSSNLAPPEAPIVVTGLYRSATTYLHALLSEQPGLRSLPYWRLRSPAGASSATGLRRAARFERAIHRRLSPDFDAAHPITADGAEECLFLFENAAAGTLPFFVSDAYDHADHLLSQDPLPAYRFYRDQLTLLTRGWQERLVVKWPFHLWRLEALFEIFPDATVLVCQRDPAAAVASTCSLAAAAQRPFSNAEPDGRRLGAFWTEMAERALSSELLRLDPRVIPVDFAELRTDPNEVLARLLSALSLPGSQASQPSISSDSSQRPSRLSYRASDYSLDRSPLESRLSALSWPSGSST